MNLDEKQEMDDGVYFELYILVLCLLILRFLRDIFSNYSI